jgi:diguanylate cyclase (GGDEF)-like protein
MEEESNIIVDILTLCLSIDKQAVTIYGNFSKSCGNEELAAFWKQKAREEARHVDIWKRLLALAEAGAIPNIFDEPLRVKGELESIISKVDELSRSITGCRDIPKSFLLALRMEFYALHPAFAMLFRFISDTQQEKLPEAHYDDHLNDFFEIMKRHDALTPELEFISETISHLWRDNARLAVESNTDGLTKIFNRKGFFNTIKPLSYLAQRNRLPAAVVMIDIDDFKRVNDTHGHQAGDRTLARVAELIRANIRQSDILGRYGGEEFCIFVLSSEKKSLKEFAEKIRREIENRTRTTIPVTVSIGVASGLIAGEPEKGIEALIKRADECLYRAKDAGKNVVVLD